MIILGFICLLYGTAAVSLYWYDAVTCNLALIQERWLRYTNEKNCFSVVLGLSFQKKKFKIIGPHLGRYKPNLDFRQRTLS